MIEKFAFQCHPMGLQIDTVRFFVKAGLVTNSHILPAPRRNEVKIGESGSSEWLRKKIG